MPNKITPTTPLRRARKEACLTINEVAAAVGWDSGNLSRVERGQRCSYEMAERLVKFYGGNLTVRDILAPPNTRSPRSPANSGAAAQ